MSRQQTYETMNRRGGRRIVQHSGSIQLGWFKHVECTIRDISSGGARLALPYDTVLPEEFKLKSDLFRGTKLCITRWEYGGEIGVEFL